MTTERPLVDTLILLGQSGPWGDPWTPTWSGPLWLPILLAIACIAVVAACYLFELRGVSFVRRLFLTLLRSAAVLLIAWMMFGWIWTPYAEEPADLLLLVDASRSMLTEDIRSGGDETRPRSRFDAARALLTEGGEKSLLSQLGERRRIRLAHFGEETFWLSVDSAQQRRQLAELAAQASSTRLGDAIEQALRLQRGRAAAAMVVLTDGAQTGGLPLSAAAEQAKEAGIPLYFIGLGDDRPVRDVRLHNLAYPSTVFLGDVASIEADIEMQGYAERSLQVTLKGPRAEAIASETIVVRADSPVRVRLPVRPAELGDWRFTLEIETPPGDANPENDRLEGQIRVREETVRVFVVDRRPRYDIRYLVDLLSRARKRGAQTEPAFEVRLFLQEGDPVLSRQDPIAIDAFPRAAELAQFDVIVLGDLQLSLLGAAAQRDLLDVITRGGAGLVLLPSAKEGFARWENQPLELLMPARSQFITPLDAEEAARPSVLTPIGRQTPFCLLGEKPSQSETAWKTYPAVMGLLAPQQLRPDVRVLLEARGATMADGRAAPIITSHFVGAAKVLCHWSDESWRWAAPRTRDHYDQYWMQAIRSLCAAESAPNDELFRLTTDSDAYDEGEPVRISLHFRDESLAPDDDQGVVVSLRSESVVRHLRLTRDAVRRDFFQGAATSLSPGAYTASIVRPALVSTPSQQPSFEVRSRSSETARLRPDFAALRSAAAESGGRFYMLQTAGSLLKELPQAETQRTTPLPPRSAWNLPHWAALLVLLLVSEWFLRRSSGLL